jgi:hypothetical protein
MSKPKVQTKPKIQKFKEFGIYSFGIPLTFGF